MAVTGPKRSCVRRLSFLAQAMLLLAGASGSRADQSADIRSRLNEIASSLTAGDPASAIAPFSKSFANYQKLRDYFDGLTNAFSIVNEIDVLDEADSKTESTATLAGPYAQQSSKQLQYATFSRDPYALPARAGEVEDRGVLPNRHFRPITGSVAHWHLVFGRWVERAF